LFFAIISFPCFPLRIRFSPPLNIWKQKQQAKVKVKIEIKKESCVKPCVHVLKYQFAAVQRKREVWDILRM